MEGLDDEPDQSGDAPWFFWPLVVIGTLALWYGESLLSKTPLYVPLGIAFYAGLGIVCGVLWTRMGHSLLVGLSWAVPLSAFWVLAFLFARPSIVATGLFVAGIAFFLAMVQSERLVDWWYRVVLRSPRARPPAP
jgi:hypothetical protein